MSVLTCLETYIDDDIRHFGSFLIEPLEIGQGITLGNALRRSLLSDFNGYAITGVKINNIKHEFTIIEGLREDILELLLNLKEIIFQIPFQLENSNNPLHLKGFLNIEGPTVVTAGLFKLPKNKIRIINPHQYLCTIINKSQIYIEIDIEKGKGYRLAEENRKIHQNDKLFFNKPETLNIDSLFMPIQKVNYKTKLINDSKGNIKESLNIEITTNGSITPQRSLINTLKILMNIVYPIFLDSNFLSISSELLKK